MPSLATNSDNTLTIQVRNTAGVLVDPDTISLRWKLGPLSPCNDWTTVSQGSITHVSTGIYSYTVNPTDDGRYQGAPVYLRYEWNMTNPTYREGDKVALASSEYAA